MSTNTVLGHYPDYVEAADELGGARFAVPAQVWRAWNPAVRWSMNRAFLDESLRRGRFLVTTPPLLARPGSVFLQEIAHLVAVGHPVSATHRLELL